jgi:hypothetical protein
LKKGRSERPQMWTKSVHCSQQLRIRKESTPEGRHSRSCSLLCSLFSQRFNRLYYQKPAVQQNTSANIVRHQQVHPSSLITKHYVNRPENGNSAVQEPLIVRKAQSITTVEVQRPIEAPTCQVQSMVEDRNLQKQTAACVYDDIFDEDSFYF